MRRREDDLSAWADDPIVRALTAPGTPEELAGESAAMAAFRSTSRPSRRRFASRFGAGGATFAVAVALSGGVAAAYGHALPAPIQRVAHGILGPVGVPGPSATGLGASARHHHHDATPAAAPAPTATPPGAGSTPGATAPPRALGAPGDHGKQEAAAPGVTTSPQRAPGPGQAQDDPPPAASVGDAPPASAAPTPPPASPAPTPTPTRSPKAKPAAVTISVAARRVANGSGDSVTGRLTTSSGDPVAHHTVWLAQRLTGQQRWTRVGSGRSDQDGLVTIAVPAVTHNVFLRLRAAGGPHTSGVKVVELPGMSVSTSHNGDQVDATVIADGAQVGDTLAVQRHHQGQWQQVREVTIGDNGSASFSVPAPRRAKAKVAYRVILRATRAHGWAATRFAATAA
jgi:hypothetical protein